MMVSLPNRRSSHVSHRGCQNDLSMQRAHGMCASGGVWIDGCGKFPSEDFTSRFNMGMPDEYIDWLDSIWKPTMHRVSIKGRLDLVDRTRSSSA